MFEEIVGRHRRCKPCSRALKVAPTDSTVLITGETGTGKELIARHTQALATFRPGVYQRKLCVDSSLLDRVGAVWTRKAPSLARCSVAGRFELAHTGTIFLGGQRASRKTQIALLRCSERQSNEWEVTELLPLTFASSPHQP
jgi:DNA-binding NtrC family response regulator